MWLLQDIVALIGRVLISLIFFISVLEKIFNFSSYIAYATSKNIALPEVLLILSIIIELVASLMIIVGWKTRVGAMVLFFYMGMITFAFHDFWSFDAALQIQSQIYHFLKNLAIMGGLLYVIAYGAGQFGIDSWKRRLEKKAVDVSAVKRP